MNKGDKKIVMLTAYDFQMSQALVECDVDILLVGDTLGMVVYGDENTRSVKLDEMIRHGRAVVRGAEGSDVKVVVDMPFGTCESEDSAVKNCERVVGETGCYGVKIEGAVEVVKAVVNAGVSVMGHTGLKPQKAEKFCLQGGDEDGRAGILDEARELEEAGVFAMVLECVPEDLGREVSELVGVPVIGIGAGRYCDGQVLVTNDLMGMTVGRLPKFVRRFGDFRGFVGGAVGEFCEEVRNGGYPGVEEIYKKKI